MSDNLKFKVSKEDGYFAQQEQEKIKELREKAAKDNDQKYRDEHKYHCFRCGTKSLVEIQKGAVSVDICVNDKCGALHLDAGELDALFADQGFVKKARKSIFDVFK
ncbi:MAG: zf-TFIIB domain-containing protein [Desulfuromonadales bacterium]|nr:zf-TFIIB domain-containing protein [Desulfuromonadales bacterium]